MKAIFSVPGILYKALFSSLREYISHCQQSFLLGQSLIIERESAWPKSLREDGTWIVERKLRMRSKINLLQEIMCTYIRIQEGRS